MSALPNGWLKITLAVSLGLSCLVQGIPTLNSQDAIILDRRVLDSESFLEIRADVSGNEDVRLVEREDPPKIPPDDIPDGKAEEAVQHTAMDPRDDSFKGLEDYDPTTDRLEGEDKGECSGQKTQKPLGQRNAEDSLLYSPRDTVYDLIYRAADQNNTAVKAPRKGGSTDILRAVRIIVNGKSLPYREAFIAQPKERKTFIGIRGPQPFTKNTRVEAFKTNEELAPFKDKCKKVVWQADHVQDLGLHTAIMRRDTPKDVTEADWTTCQNAVLGDADGKPTAGTDVIGKILNEARNMRGVSAAMNACKNQVVGIVARNYGTGFSKCDRSQTWGSLIYMVNAKNTYKAVTTDVAAAYRSLAKDKNSASAKALEKYMSDELSKYYDGIVGVLTEALKNPPPENDKDKKFLNEDTSNTADTPAQGPNKDSGPTAGGTPAVKPVDPPSAPSCYPKPPKFKDAHENAEASIVDIFCDINGKTALTDSKSGVTSDINWYSDGNDSTDDNYEIKVAGVPNCQLPQNLSDQHTVASPMKGVSCNRILRDAWKKCYNGGRGGVITTGCWTYSITPKH